MIVEIRSFFLYYICMRKDDIDLRDQCKHCKVNLKDSKCNNLKVRIKEEYGFHCPFFNLEDHGKH